MRPFGTHLLQVGLLCATLPGCFASHNARTVGKGQLAVEGSLGGPLVTNLGAPVPMASVHLGARYGLRDDTDLAAYLNIFNIFVPGILDVQLAGYYAIVQPNRTAGADRGPSLLLRGTVHLMTNFGRDGFDGALEHGSFRIYPDLGATFGYRYQWLNPFIGLDAILDFYPLRRGNDRRSAFALPLNADLGIDWIITARWSLTTMVKVYAMNMNAAGNLQWVVFYASADRLRRQGVLGVHLGLSYTFKP